jgi:hypothetical protein
MQSGGKQPRLYTVDEARALLPRLREMLAGIQQERRELREETEALQRLTPAMRSDGFSQEAARREQRITELSESLRRRVAEIVALDIEIKDIDAGLVDFYSLRDGRVVFLCWRIDEPTLAYWHDLDAGFRGRRPLDE